MRGELVTRDWREVEGSLIATETNHNKYENTCNMHSTLHHKYDVLIQAHAPVFSNRAF